MSDRAATRRALAAGVTERCPRCTRPAADCVCALLRPIESRVGVTIVQHPGERNHAFNTARLLERALAGAQRVVAWPGPDGRMTAAPALPPRTALLYPSEHAGALGPDAPIDHLVVLDGTWSQVRRLLRDNPWLLELPTVRLDPAEPSRYRIREEPALHCLSTIESTAMALQALEPHNRELDRLLDGFLAMVDHHLAHQRAPATRHKQRNTTLLDLLAQRDRALVVYAESIGLHARGEAPELLHWTAVRVSDGALFDGLLAPPAGANPCVLDEMGLSDAEPEPRDAFLARWAAFVRHGDVAFAWSPHTRHLCPTPGMAVHGLKSVAMQRLGVSPGRLADTQRAEPLPLRGRASHRLAHARALVDVLLASRDPAPPIDAETR